MFSQFHRKFASFYHFKGKRNSIRFKKASIIFVHRDVIKKTHFDFFFSIKIAFFYFLDSNSLQTSPTIYSMVKFATTNSFVKKVDCMILGQT